MMIICTIFSENYVQMFLGFFSQNLNILYTLFCHLFFGYFLVFFMIFVIFVDLRCVQQAEFTIRRDRKKSCFWQILTNFCKKKTIFLSRKIHVFQNFRKCFVVFWYRHKCFVVLGCRAVFSETYFLFWRKLSKIWKNTYFFFIL